MGHSKTIEQVCAEYGAVRVNESMAFKVMKQSEPISEEDAPRVKRIIISALATSRKYQRNVFGEYKAKRAKGIPFRYGWKKKTEFWDTGWKFNFWEQIIGPYIPPLRVVTVTTKKRGRHGFLTRSLHFAIRKVLKGSPCDLCQGIGWGIVWRRRNDGQLVVNRNVCPKCEGLLFS